MHMYMQRKVHKKKWCGSTYRYFEWIWATHEFFFVLVFLFLFLFLQLEGREVGKRGNAIVRLEPKIESHNFYAV